MRNENSSHNRFLCADLANVVCDGRHRKLPVKLCDKLPFEEKLDNSRRTSRSRKSTRQSTLKTTIENAIGMALHGILMSGRAPADQGLFFGVALVASAVMSSAFYCEE
jgi:hypothetical protein